MAANLLFNLLLKLGLLLFLLNSTNAQGLKVGFYQQECPTLEGVISSTVAPFIDNDPSLAAPLLRLHFHDCFVRGCDASVLLNSTLNNQAEKDAAPNLSLRGFDIIDTVKAEVEKVCPGIVSCADILALVAKDAVSMINGPSWQVPTGRRDGLTSSAAEALANLPPPFFNITQLKASFLQKGLSVKDLVVLSGGHTIGISHCSSFSNRLYNFTGNGDADPTMDPKYVAQLKEECKPGDSTTTVPMDPGSSTKFDTDYYTVVATRKGLFQSDAALIADSETKAYINLQIASPSPSFFHDFGVSMVNMGNIGVLTGNAGKIRKKCSVING